MPRKVEATNYMDPGKEEVCAQWRILVFSFRARKGSGQWLHLGNTFETLAVPHLIEALCQRKEEVSGGLTLL